MTRHSCPCPARRSARRVLWGNSKDRDLDRELPFIFTETLGAWATKEREHVVPRMYRTTASDSESGSDGEEDDDT